MFKKIVFVKNSSELTNSNGVYKFLVKFANNFFCYSRQPLELNRWYEIVYYESKKGFFRINEARTIDYRPGQSINQTNITINQQNIFLMNDVIEIINQNYQTCFFLPKFSKYVLYSCGDSCWQGNFCNNCIDFSSDKKNPIELESGDYIWEDKIKSAKLIHKRTWMAEKLLE